MRVGVGRLETDRFAIVEDGVVAPSLAEEQVGEVVVRRRRSGREAQRLFQVRAGLRQATHGRERDAEVPVHLRVRGIEPQGLFELLRAPPRVGRARWRSIPRLTWAIDAEGFFVSVSRHSVSWSR